jgi:hypothetical protein
VPPWTDQARERRIGRLARELNRRPRSKTMTARLNAAVARLYGLDARRFEQVLDGFPLVPVAERRAALRAFERHA